MEQQWFNIIRENYSKGLPGFDAQKRMMGRVIDMPPQIPPTAKQSAVLCLLYPVETALHILLMKRMEDKGAHSGQVSFPGGRYEIEDGDLKVTALREAYEEVGVLPHTVDVVGALTPLYIPVSNFNVQPYLGFLPQRPHLELSRSEVSYVLEVPIPTLFHPERKIQTDVTSPAVPGVLRKVNAYKLEDGTIIWGATAMILSELEAIVGTLN